jgi:hypothetical protein
MFTSKDKRTELPMAAEPAPKRPAPNRIMTSIIANGVKISGSIFADGDEVQVGKFKLTFFAAKADK